METNDTLQVDVDKVLADKNPGLARLLPRFVKAYLKRIVHQDEVNYVLRSFSHQPPVGFVRSTLDYMEITHRAVGLERLSLDGRYWWLSAAVPTPMHWIWQQAVWTTNGAASSSTTS